MDAPADRGAEKFWRSSPIEVDGALPDLRYASEIRVPLTPGREALVNSDCARFYNNLLACCCFFASTPLVARSQHIPWSGGGLFD